MCYFDFLGLIYIYNEYCGYIVFDWVFEVVICCMFDDIVLIVVIICYWVDECKYYEMFCCWFELCGVKLFFVDCMCGYIDCFIEIVFGICIDLFDIEVIVCDDVLFE